MKCPNTKEPCPEANEAPDGCPWWIILTANADKIGRCAVPWIPNLLIEIRVAIDKLNPDNKEKPDVGSG